MKHLKTFFAFMLMVVLSIGQVWGYTITFSTNSGDGTSASTSTACSIIVSDGSSYLSGNLATATKVYYNGGSGLKLGASSAAGVIKMNLASAVTPTSIVVSAKLYNSSKAATLKVNGSATQSITADFSNLTFDITSEISYLQLESSKYCWIESITVNTGSTETTVSLEQVAISGTPTTTTYEEGDLFDVTGLTVTGTYDIGDPAEITEGITWKARTTSTSNDEAALDAYTLTQGQKSLQVQATVSEIASEWFDVTGLTVNEHVVTPGEYTINLTNTLFGTTENSNISSAIQATQDDITLVVNGTGSTKPRTDATYLRFYGSSSLTLSVPTGYNITKIVISANQSDYSAPSANVGSFDTDTKTWTGKANEVVWSFSAKSFIGQIKVTYVAEVKYAVAFSAPTGGTLTIKDGDNAITSGDTFSEGKELNVVIAADADNHYIGGAVAVKKTSDNSDVTDDVYDATTGKLTLKDYAITVSASFTPTYAIETVAEGGSIALSYTAGGASQGRAIAGTEITATATDDGDHVFSTLALSDNVTDQAIDGNEAVFTMPAGDVTITATFTEKQDPYIAAKIDEEAIAEVDFGAIDQDAPVAAKTFSLNGDNLTEGTLSLELLYGTNFTVSPSSIDVNGTLSAQTITITPKSGLTATAGTYEDLLTISGGGLAESAYLSIEIKLIVTPTYTVNWIVNGNTESPYKTQTAVEGADLDIPNDPTTSGSCAGLVFQGWVTSQLASAQVTAPTYVTTDGLQMPENGATFYAVFAEEVPGEDEIVTYSHTISSQTWSANGEQTLSDVSWTLDNNGNYYGNDGTKGQQIGSGGSPATSMSLSTSGISGAITSVKIYTSGASSISGTVAVSVNGTNFKNGNNTTASLTATNTGYEFTGNAEGEIVISWAQTSSKAIYFKQIEVKHAVPTDPVYGNFVTSCVACSKVDLAAAEVENGSIKFQQNNKDVTSVKTCDAAQEVAVVVADSEIGYELTGVALSGTASAKASYADGVISIQKDAEGALTATATFAKSNYAVTYSAPEHGSFTIKVADGTAASASTTAQYGQTITLEAGEVEGYLFSEWSVKDANNATVAVTNNTFSMPASAVTVSANFIEVMTVAEALALIPNADDASEGNVYVRAFVSHVDASSFNATYGTMHYYLSDNGSRENELMVYYGYKGANTAFFTASDEIKAGDKVVVYGPITNYKGTKEFKTKSSYIYELTEASHFSYEIVGELTQTDFAVGDVFGDSYMTNLSLNDVYDTGYKVAVANVTFSANKTTLAASDETITISAKDAQNTVLATKEFAISVSSATLESYVIKDGYKTEYYAGEEFVKPTIIATLSDGNEIEAEATSCTGYNMSVADSYEVTVSYKYGDITLNDKKYKITVKAIYNNANDPLPASVAKSIINARTDDSESGNDEIMWVRGKVSQKSNPSGNVQTYYISDDGTTTDHLQVFKGSYFNGEAFATDNQVVVGDEVIVKGKVQKYDNKTPELKSSQVVYLLKGAAPTFSIANVNMEVGMDDIDVAALGTTVTGGSNGVISLVSANENVVSVSGTKLHAVAASETPVTITATLAVTANEGSANYKSNTTTFTVSVAAAQVRHILTLKAMGSVYDTKNAVAGSSIYELLDGVSDPDIIGYAFQGWSKVENSAEDIISSSNDLELDDDLTLYAVYTSAVYYKKVKAAPSNWAGEYLIVYETNSKARVWTGVDAASCYTQTDIDNNTIAKPSGTVSVTIAKMDDGYSIKVNGGTNDGKYLKNASSNGITFSSDAVANTISYSSNSVVIECGGKVFKYNSSSGNDRFRYFGSAQQPIQLYKKKGTEGETVSVPTVTVEDGEVVESTEIFPSGVAGKAVVEEGGTLTITEELTADEFVVEEGGTLKAEDEDHPLNVGEFVLNATASDGQSGGQSGQLIGTHVNYTSLSIEIKLCDGPMDAEASSNWYCISAPFDVALNGGFFWGDGTPMDYNVDFQIFEYDGSKRSNSGNGWKRVNGNKIKAGVAHFIGFDNERTNQNTIRLKSMGTTIPAPATITFNEYDAEDGANANWNGMANPTLHHIGLTCAVSVFDYINQLFHAYLSNAYNFIVSSPFFAQTTGTYDLTAPTSGEFFAPQRQGEDYTYCVRVSKPDASRFDNQTYVRASETASANFEQDHDMASLNATTSARAALVWTENYGMRLAIEEAPLYGNTVSYELGISAPAAGEYVLSVAEQKDNASLYLTYNGSIMWDLSSSPITLSLEKGVNYGYGLLMQVNAPHVATGVDNAADNLNVKKIILNEHVYILRDGQLFDITGKIAK